MRLLPWAGPGGKPCYLSTDDPNSRMSGLADNIEATQLGIASELSGEAIQVDDGDKVPDLDALTLLAAQLFAALGDVLRVATSRGHRLVTPESF
ncbi:hypothetical protein [Streptomyces sp. NPDC094437]|uniref:hypothetical protein n=1 Tax=Streptomyces sp. NPDC094437 TaxID=3366060 RepID=UPI0038187FA3